MPSKFNLVFRAAAQCVTEHAGFTQFLAAPQFAGAQPNFDFGFLDAQSNFFFPLGKFEQGEFRATHLAFVNFGDDQKFGAVGFEDPGFDRFVSQFPNFGNFEQFKAKDGTFGRGRETGHAGFPFNFRGTSRLAGALLIAALLVGLAHGSRTASVKSLVNATTAHLCQHQLLAVGHGHPRYAGI